MTWDRHRQLPDDAPVDDADVSAVLDRAMGRDVGVRDVGWRSRFHCEERQVVRYRHGRVLLAGDAAHVHSPMGGQGMNTGIQDAINLAWKLDAVLAGADDAVLDSYHDERHPIGRRVLFQSGAMMRAVTLRPRPARAVRDAVSGRLLRWRPSAGLIAGSFSGVGLRYARRRGDHPLVGTRATTIPLTEGTVADRQRDGRFLLVREADRRDDGPAVLVRPDGYIAWAGAGDDLRRARDAWTTPQTHRSEATR
ncbi:FAD-dependent monooxygenase [Actinomycetospora flava]|uniref:FAD-dependent monooxygenase n=1 Tax=Actinomycetospora flava TaxID=3129232 RepID=A0ABU8M8T7_9PSEU